MPAALPLTTMIEQSSSKTRVQNMKTVQFGNGYAQSKPFGINSIRDEWNISYPNLTSSERTTLVSVLDSVGSWDYVTWTAFGDSTEKKWKLPSGWSERYDGNHYHITFTLQQTF